MKWDDQPVDLHSVPDALDRAFQIATAEPAGPVYVCIDTAIQERLVDPDDMVADYKPGVVPAPPAPQSSDVAYMAEKLSEAELPVVVTDYTAANALGFDLLVQVAEAWGLAVVDMGARLNFPSLHRLRADRSILSDADVVLALEVDDLHGVLLGSLLSDSGGRLVLWEGTTLIEAGTRHLRARSWSQDLQRLVPSTRKISSAAVPLLEALMDEAAAHPIPDEVLATRSEIVTARASRKQRVTRASRSAGKDGIAPDRLAFELWPLIRHLPWTLVHGDLGGAVYDIWEFDEDHRHIGWHGGGGLGYGPGASAGASIAQTDRISINLQPDGDLLYAPQALWTASHLGLPLLTVVHNNRQYENTVQHARDLARVRGRGEENRYVGSSIENPPVDMGALARSMGVWASQPVTQVEELAATMTEAIAVVQGGQPALVDVWTRGS